ncbi:hypothetical protein BGZ65_003227 [Modicella reniformis]|uniref:Uncharacterized protein n=1 Tax=Modicella reniformis TaxID=1440133 RepID=A0A9P6M3B5_9FUNG|nr:hypothetical protein BGZ65_003227 [Modicella reniformis]
MTSLFRFTTAEGLVHLLDSNRIAVDHESLLKVDSVHGTLAINGTAITPSPLAVSSKDLFDFDQLVCDFDETITDHDTTSSFDTLANQIRPDHFEDPQMTWPEILQAYLEDLEKVDVGDLCHLKTDINNNNNKDHHLHHPRPTQHRLLDPRIRELNSHIDGRNLTPEPELPVPRIPSLQPWIHSQVRRRPVEQVSLDRVFESGNLVGLTKSQIRAFGRDHIRLRPGMIDFLRAFVQEQDRKEKELEISRVEQQQQQQQQEQQHQQQQQQQNKGSDRRGELWIVSVNWSEDLIRGAMDQIFGSEEATECYLPRSNLISSDLQFMEEGHEMLMKRMKNNSCNSGNKDTESNRGISEHLSNGKVKARCLTGTDKLNAFQKIQKDYAAKHGLALTDTKWAYLGDSSTDLGCLGKALMTDQ